MTDDERVNDDTQPSCAVVLILVENLPDLVGNDTSVIVLVVLIIIGLLKIHVVSNEPLYACTS
ncbi:hypothetical protein GCM10007112_18410 [Vulcanisaeta souniana JCM 11219]|uniref:Uncharacterized protein n=1 Tax=Vulcanisaeta souniana JCM 11219 TaxID=1293586 RepID=A0A830EG45_9CREN|nr:hypothetical protein GCM10007112_18410 [Vulcanisaeta souniana JCM 11219]